MKDVRDQRGNKEGRKQGLREIMEKRKRDGGWHHGIGLYCHGFVGRWMACPCAPLYLCGVKEHTVGAHIQ